MAENGLNKPKPFRGGGKRPGAGRHTKKLERDYFAVAKRACSERDWLTICKRAVAVAKGPKTAHPIAVAKARDFLLKALSLEQAVKVEVTGALTTAAFTDDVTKILADPEATERMLDAIHGTKNRIAPALPSTGVNGTNGVAH